MVSLERLEDELKSLIVESLLLEDVKPGEISTTDPLFVDGLGLDSIDALELAMAIDQKWGVKFSADDEHNREIFGSVQSLAKYINGESESAGGMS